MGDREVTKPSASQRTPSRRVRVAVAAAALVVGLGATWWVVRAGAVAPPHPDTSGADADQPPPDFPAPRTEEERVQRTLDLLLSGDPEDAEWARARLVAAGEPARRLVAETARRCLRSNRAFVEHAFEILLHDPRQEDVPLAAEALDNPDPEVVKRACILLGRAGGPAAREQMSRIGSAAASPWPLPSFAMDALVELGGDDGVAQLERITLGAEFTEGVRDQALARMGRVGGEKARAVLLRELARATTDDRRIAASEGLIAMGDATPAPVLRAMWSARRDQRAITLLARAKDDVAFTELEGRVRAPLESEDRRVQALIAIDPFPPERRHALMRFAGAPDMPREVRVEAWSQLWRDGDPTDRDTLLRMLRAEGKDAREGCMVAGLVLGRVRDPAHSKALLLAEAANRGDRELRTILLRAVILCGSPDAAETVARAMADDPSGHLATDSLAFELSVMFTEAKKPFLDAIAPFVRDALEGRLGSPGPMARVQLLLVAGRACGREITPRVEACLADDDRQMRETAAAVIVNVPGPNSVAALKNAWWRRQDAVTRGALHRALERVVLSQPVK